MPSRFQKGAFEGVMGVGKDYVELRKGSKMTNNGGGLPFRGSF